LADRLGSGGSARSVAKGRTRGAAPSTGTLGVGVRTARGSMATEASDVTLGTRIVHSVGDKVLYWSGTHNEWVRATVRLVCRDSAGIPITYDLDCKTGAEAALVRRRSSASGEHVVSLKGPAPNIPACGDAGFDVGARVQYWSASKRRWIEGVVQSRYEQDGVTMHDLNCKRGALTGQLRLSPVPFDAGERVEYYSSSANRWLPTKFLRYHSANGTCDLDIKSAAPLDKVRKAQLDIEALPSSASPAARHPEALPVEQLHHTQVHETDMPSPAGCGAPAKVAAEPPASRSARAAAAAAPVANTRTAVQLEEQAVEPTQGTPECRAVHAVESRLEASEGKEAAVAVATPLEARQSLSGSPLRREDEREELRAGQQHDPSLEARGQKSGRGEGTGRPAPPSEALGGAETPEAQMDRQLGADGATRSLPGSEGAAGCEDASPAAEVRTAREEGAQGASRHKEEASAEPNATVAVGTSSPTRPACISCIDGCARGAASESAFHGSRSESPLAAQAETSADAMVEAQQQGLQELQPLPSPALAVGRTASAERKRSREEGDSRGQSPKPSRGCGICGRSGGSESSGSALRQRRRLRRRQPPTCSCSEASDTDVNARAAARADKLLASDSDVDVRVCARADRLLAALATPSPQEEDEAQRARSAKSAHRRGEGRRGRASQGDLRSQTNRPALGSPRSPRSRGRGAAPRRSAGPAADLCASLSSSRPRPAPRSRTRSGASARRAGREASLAEPRLRRRAALVPGAGQRRRGHGHG